MTQDFADDRLARTLLDRSRRGDGEAFAQLYQQQASAIYALAFRLTADRSKAEDVTQETFLKALKGLRGYRGDAPVQVWLKRMAANAGIDHLRIEARWRRLDESVLEMPTDLLPDLDAQRTCGHLAKLRPEARTVVWLHTVEGWSHTELAQRFGRSESWSKSLLSRSLALMRQWVQEESREIA